MDAVIAVLILTMIMLALLAVFLFTGGQKPTDDQAAAITFLSREQLPLANHTVDRLRQEGIPAHLLHPDGRHASISVAGADGDDGAVEVWVRAADVERARELLDLPGA